MSYGIDAGNNNPLVGMATADNPNQLDVLFFTDCTQTQATSPLFLDGAEYYSTVANGGAIGNNTAVALNAVGYTGSSGVVSLQTGVTNNATGYGALYTTTNLVPGITTASTQAITKYEYEIGLRTLTVHTNAVRGAYRLGFQNSVINTAPTTGVYFEYLCNGTVTDTTWKVVILSPSGSTRVDTGVTVSNTSTYRLYLSVERDSTGTVYTTNYKIKNFTAGTSTEGTASPSSDTHYPSAATNYMGSVTINTKAVTATTTSNVLYIDYLGTRIRRPIFREILISP